MKTSSILFIAIFLTLSVDLCLADEKKDHICFRTMDSNEDGVVTFKEFEKFYQNEKEKFKEADLDKNDKLTHDEYHNILGHGAS